MAEEIIKARIVFDKPNLAGAGALGKTKGNAGGALGALAGGKGGGLLGAGALAGAVAAGVHMLVESVKKGFEALKKASPRLQQSVEIFQKAVMLILRPIGDIFAFFLRPLAIALLRYAIKFYKNFQEWMKKLLGEKVKEAPELIIAGGGKGETSKQIDWWQSLMDKFEGWGPLFQGIIVILEILHGAWLAIWGSLKIVVALVIAFATGLKFLLDIVLAPLIPTLKYIADIFLIVGNAISAVGTALLGLMTGSLTTTEFLDALSVAFDNFMGGLETAFQNWMDNNTKFMMPLVEALKKYIAAFSKFWNETWDKIKASFEKAWTALKKVFNEMLNFFTSAIPNAISKLISKIKSMLSFGSSDKESSSTTKKNDFIMRPGQSAQSFSKNDTIIGVKDLKSLGAGNNQAGNTTIQVNINALDASSIDQKTVKKLTDEIAKVMKRGISGRSTESLGAF